MTDPAHEKASLAELLDAARARVEAMTPAEREAMYAEQRASYVRAEMSWPKARYQWVDGVKVYESYADYCND